MILNKKTIQDTIKLAEELCVLLKPLHPVETLKQAYLEFILQNLEKETELAIGIKEIRSRFLVEYLQSLFISIDLKEDLRLPTDEKEWEKIKEKSNSICDKYLSPLLINQDDNTFSQENKSLSHKILTSWIHVRGNKPRIHEYEHLNSLLMPHNEVLKKLYKVTVQDILDGVKKYKLYCCFCSNSFKRIL